MKLKFSKENRMVSDVELEILEATKDFESIGRKKTHPIHYKVINQILKMVKAKLKGTNYFPELSKLWVSPQGGLHLKDTPNPEHPSSYLIERVYCRIDLNNIDDTEKNMAIGILFNEHGYNLAFGVNVRECTNFTVFGEHFHSTYGGEKKADHAAIMELLDKWLGELNVRRAWYYRLVDALKSINFTQNHVTTVLGDLLKLSVARNNGFRKEVNPGLNQTQVAQLALQAYENREKISITAWEMLNWGTNLLKPGQSDLADLQADIQAFNNFFISQYTGLTPDMFQDVVEHMKALEQNDQPDAANQGSNME